MMTKDHLIPASELIAQLDALTPQQMKAFDVPGASIAVIRQGRVLWSKTYGLKHVELGHPASPGTVFEAASLSKPIVAYAVVQLCRRGRMALDAPLSVYLLQPFVRDDARLQQITARRVLSHCSGLQHWIRAEGEQPAIQFDPGTRFSYSSLGYQYLQQAIEQVTGEPLAATVQREVLSPLQMAHSSMVWREDYDIDAAHGYDEDGRRVEKWKPLEAVAPASLHTTALDYARFMIEMLRTDDDDIRQMLQPQIAANAAVSWGLGWGLETSAAGAAFWHWGDNGSFKAFCLGYRDAGSAVVILCNGYNGLKMAEPLVNAALGNGSQPHPHPAFEWLEEFYS